MQFFSIRVNSKIKLQKEIDIQTRKFYLNQGYTHKRPGKHATRLHNYDHEIIFVYLIFTPNQAYCYPSVRCAIISNMELQEVEQRDVHITFNFLYVSTIMKADRDSKIQQSEERNYQLFQHLGTSKLGVGFCCLSGWSRVCQVLLVIIAYSIKVLHNPN